MNKLIQLKNHIDCNKTEPRFYRNGMGMDRFYSFIIAYKDSDIWIGIDKQSYCNEIAEFAHKKLIETRNILEAYILQHPEFESSYSPITLQLNAPQIVVEMAKASEKANTGPMAAVAGAISEYIAKAIKQTFDIEEIVIENGGDLFLGLRKNLVLSVYAGESPLSEKIGIEIPAMETPLGVCTSAGTVGPSFSFGKADAVMVACKNTALADAFATAIGNRVKTAADIENELYLCDQNPEIISLLIVCEEKLGIKGKFELKLLK